MSGEQATWLVVDTETTGVDALNDHIVTVTLMSMSNSAQILQQASWMVDFGGEIPDGAAAVHGISTERMRAEGTKDVAGVIRSLFNIIQTECVHGTATLVAYKAAFDLTLLETERRRHCPDVPPIDYSRVNVFDPLIAWKRAVPRRRGKRILIEAAKAHGVPVDETKAHDAAYDCYLAGSVAAALIKRTAWLRNQSPRQRHLNQIGWAATQAADLQGWFRSNGKPHEVVRGEWPTLYHPTTQAAAAA